MGVHSEIIIMKAFIFATILAVATAVVTNYLADLPEVHDAKDAFRAVWDKHAAGEVTPVATAYIADTPEVADAKDAFRAVWDKYAAGEVPLPVAPTHEVAPVVAAPAIAPVAVAAPYWNNYYGAYPYAHAGYPYAHAAYPYAHAAYPYALTG